VDFLWTKHVWLILLWPALGALANGLLIPAKRRTADLASVVGIGAVALSFCCAVFATLELVALNISDPQPVEYFTWISAGSLQVPFALLYDSLSATMCLMITGVGLLIHIYSRGYMAHDEHPGRFFAYLNLFMAMMLLLVLSDNFLLMFVGWEGVGLCSYLLIGFWHKRESASKAGLKAFLVNRVGDAGFLLAMMLIFVTFGSLRFGDVLSFSAIRAVHENAPLIIFAITGLLFIGAVGKSAQIPLYVWLPDAMEGPTPVSALIHAATMVTAGVYMIVRCHFLYMQPSSAHVVVAWIGVITALVAGLMALAQRDIKRVLAYSTISQLGYMFLACGVGAYVAAVLHVVTHAFFKACLFLGAGSVMHGVNNETDIVKMGGLAKRMPRTHWTFLVACLSIAGIAPLAGFFSKDEILHHVFVSHSPHAKVWWGMAIGTAFLTAFYMFRLFALTFRGESRMSKKDEEHVHESPSVMTVPLVILAVLAIIGGMALAWPFGHGRHLLNAFMSPWVGSPYEVAGEHGGEGEALMLMGVSFAIALAGVIAGWRFFSGPYRRVERVQRSLGLLYTWPANKFWVDEAYHGIIVGPLDHLAGWLGRVFDAKGVDGLVNGIGAAVAWIGEGVRRLQTGQVRAYALAVLVGAVAMVLYVLREIFQEVLFP